MVKNSTKFIAALGVVAGLGGAIAVPVATTHAETQTSNTDVSVAINNTLALYATSSVTGTLVNNGPVQTLTTTDTTLSPNIAVKVTTNNSAGYTVTAKGGGATPTTSLVSGNDTIPYGEPVQGTSAWELIKKVGQTETHLALDTSGVEVDSSSKPTGVDGTTTELIYKASAAGNQAAGTYTGQVVFTATTK